MIVIVVDDEVLALKTMVETIRRVRTDAEIYPYRDPSEALRAVEEGLRPDIVFSDIRMFDMTGIEFAHKLKLIYPYTNIVFATGYDEYMGDAIRLHASGYLLKPIDEGELADQFDNLTYPIETETSGYKVYARTFGNFEVFYNGKPIHFLRAKSKELLAYLIDQRGSSCTRAELLVNLFEDDSDKKANQYLSQAFFALMKTLKAIDSEGMIVKNRDSYAVDTTQFGCDYYDYLDGDVRAINAYQGKYMANYSNWSDFTGPKKRKF